MIDIDVYSLSVKLKFYSNKVQELVLEFLEKYYKQEIISYSQNTYSHNKNEQRSLTYAVICDHAKEIWLHRRQFTHLKIFIEENYNDYLHYFNIDKNNVFENYESDHLNIKVRNNWSLREDQLRVKDFLIQDNSCKCRLVPIQTGKGKTVTSLVSATYINERLVIIILPTYIDKWINDLKSIYDITDKEIMVVQGTRSLKSLIELAAQERYNIPVTIISLTTYKIFISEYEENTQQCRFEYKITPIDFFPLLRAGTLLIDETHQHFYGIYKILLLSNIKRQIGLSATLESNDIFIKKLHNIVYPQQCRYNTNEYDRYATIYPLLYYVREQNLKFIRTSEYGSNIYSHTAFEKSILRKEHLKANYISIINEAIRDYYIEEYQENDKLIIFVATINLATILTNFLSEEYPNLSVKRYCEDDPYENVIEPDIRVTTALSAGTAIDIPNLRVAIQTVSVSSIVTNLQTLGRLRKLKDRDVKFCYLYAENINKQRQYHFQRLNIYRDKAEKIISRRLKSQL